MVAAKTINITEILINIQVGGLTHFYKYRLLNHYQYYNVLDSDDALCCEVTEFETFPA